MPRYIKAYPASDFQRFPGWTIINPTTDRASPAGANDHGADILYLHPDGTVRSGIHEDAPVVFEDGGPGWREFCARELGFQVPDWEAEAEAVRRRVLADPVKAAGDGSQRD